MHRQVYKSPVACRPPPGLDTGETAYLKANARLEHCVKGVRIPGRKHRAHLLGETPRPIPTPHITDRQVSGG